MERFHRYYRLHRVLSSPRSPVSCAALEGELECSRASVMRIIEELRSVGAPIEYLREHNGYRYTPGKAFELPGIWFSPSELEALFIAEHLLERAEPGLLAETLGPLKHKLNAIFRQEHLGRGELVRRVRILPMAGRGSGRYFTLIADALTRRRRILMTYRSRGGDETTEREISPQRLVHYRDNWYLDAWDHRKRALRTFSTDCVREARVMSKRASDIPERRLDTHFASAYGIFSGKPRRTAVLRFSSERARWVADEVWHPRQRGSFGADGSYTLEFPYSGAHELVMDILKHGPDVEVLKPSSLRSMVHERLELTLAQYPGRSTSSTDGRGATSSSMD